MLQQQLASLKIYGDSNKSNSLKIDTTNDKEKNIQSLKDFFNNKFDQVNNEVKKQEVVTTSLRQALNPINPDEILTIARLKDQIIELQKYSGY